MEPLTNGTSVPKEWSEYKQRCSKEEPCPATETCMAERSIYVSEDGTDLEWTVGHGCFVEGISCEGGTAFTFADPDAGDDGSYWYGEIQCDLDFPYEVYNVNSGAMKSAGIATLASLIAFSMNLF